MNSNRYALKRWIPEFRRSATENQFRAARCDTDRTSSLLYLTVASLSFVVFHWVDRRNFAGSAGSEIEVLLALRLLPLLVVGIVAVWFWRTTQPKVVTSGTAVAIAAYCGTYLAVASYTLAHGGESAWTTFFPVVGFFFALFSPSSFKAGVFFALLVTLFAALGTVVISVTEAAMLRMAALLLFSIITSAIITAVLQRNHRRLYAKLREAEDRRRRIAQSLSDAERMGSAGLLVTSVAHDLSNFLTPVLGFTEMLRTNLQDDKPQQALAQQAFEAAQRASGLVRRLLDDASREPAKTRVCVRDSVETFRETLQDAVAESTLNLELPDADIHILASPQAFERVLVNLVINAGEATSDRDGVVYVRFDRMFNTDDSTTCVRMRVRDNGKGIDPEIRENLFDPLVTTKVAGHGLGLASVQQILKEHGGSIEARSLERGAVFEVLWPLAPDDLGETTQSVA